MPKQPTDPKAERPSAPEAMPAEPMSSPLEIAILSMRGASSSNIALDANEFLSLLNDPLERARAEGKETPTFLSVLPGKDIPDVDAPAELAPIPEEYDVDLISALVQDPFRMFVYWEARPETVASIERLFTPEEMATFKPMLRVTEKESDKQSYYSVLYRGSEWFSVFPDRTYLVEFGVYSRQFGFIRLMAAPEARTPRGTVAPEAAPQPEYRISASRFRRVLDASGFATDSQVLPRERLAEWFPPQVIDAVFTAGDGQPLEREQVQTLPRSIRDILEELFDRDGGEMAALALMHYLPAVLRDTYLARLAARGVRVGFANPDKLIEAEYIEEIEAADDDWVEEVGDLEWGDWIEEEAEFDLPGLQRFGIGSSAGSELGSMKTRRRRRLPQRKLRRREVERPVPSPWLPSMERPGSLRLSGGGFNELFFDLDALLEELP